MGPRFTLWVLAAGVFACAGDKDTDSGDDGVSPDSDDTDTDTDTDSDTDADTDADTDTDTDADSDTDTDSDTGVPNPFPCADADAGMVVPAVLLGSTIGAVDQMTGSCTPNTAPEYAYTFTAPADDRYGFDTYGSTYDTLLYVRDGCQGGQELACNDDVHYGQVRVSHIGLDMVAGQQVMIVVDGWDIEAGDYVLNIGTIPTTEGICDDGLDDDIDGGVDCDDPDCAGFPSCAPSCPDEVAGGFPITIAGSTIGSPDESTNSCASDLAVGVPFYNPEWSIAFSAPDDGTYVFALPLVGTPFDAVLAIYDACGGIELACDDNFGLGGDTIAVDLSAGQTVVVVVDGTYGVSAPFELEIYEPTRTEIDCADGLDNDLNTYIDCADFQCDPEPSCLEDCANGVDDDGNFRIDCGDRDCDLDPACAESCANGMDDDGDFLVDCADVFCDTDAGCVEDCDNGRDDDFDGRLDCLDGACANDATCIAVCPELSLVSVPGTVMGTTFGRSDDVVPTCGFTWVAPSSDVTVEFVAPNDGRFVFDTLGSTFDTVLAATDGCGGPELDCDDFGTGEATLLLDLLAGETATLVVDGTLGSGPFQLNVAEVLTSETFCSDDLDDDLDGQIDCLDAECDLDPACLSTCPEDVLVGMANGSTVGETDDNLGSCAMTVGESDLTWEFIAPAAAVYSFDTLGSSFDTVLYVLDDCSGAELACNDNFGGFRQSGLQLMLNAGQRVIVVVDGAFGDAGDVTVTAQ